MLRSYCAWTNCHRDSDDPLAGSWVAAQAIRPNADPSKNAGWEAKKKLALGPVDFALSWSDPSIWGAHGSLDFHFVAQVVWVSLCQQLLLLSPRNPELQSSFLLRVFFPVGSDGLQVGTTHPSCPLLNDLLCPSACYRTITRCVWIVWFVHHSKMLRAVANSFGAVLRWLVCVVLHRNITHSFHSAQSDALSCFVSSLTL